jgi:septal ring factor EnvC (AmiA/AmiB activator)
MQRIALVLVGGLLASASVWADPQSAANANAQAVAHVNQRVAQHQAEVDHLQQDVGQQESARVQDAERLQQQDRTIAELRQQLKAAQDAAKVKAPAAAGH